MPKLAVFAGHGGADPGAQGNGFKEKDINLALSNELTRILRGRGYEVINNRTTDTDRDINADAALANNSGVDAVIELHMNSNEGAPHNGSEVFYSVKDTGRGRALAEAILRNLTVLGFADRGVKTSVNAQGQDTFGILRMTNGPTVLVEAAFINSPSDMARFNVEEVAMAIANGIGEVFPAPSGSAVIRDVQDTLNRRYGSGLEPDGVYGPATRAAIVAGFQTELNSQFGRELTVDGVYGPRTQAATVNVGPGAEGNMTWLIQAALLGEGYNVTPDGIYGPLTAAAVRAFQNDRGLAVDGIARPKTQMKLFT